MSIEPESPTHTVKRAPYNNPGAWDNEYVSQHSDPDTPSSSTSTSHSRHPSKRRRSRYRVESPPLDDEEESLDNTITTVPELSPHTPLQYPSRRRSSSVDSLFSAPPESPRTAQLPTHRLRQSNPRVTILETPFDPAMQIFISTKARIASRNKASALGNRSGVAPRKHSLITFNKAKQGVEVLRGKHTANTAKPSLITEVPPPKPPSAKELLAMGGLAEGSDDELDEFEDELDDQEEHLVMTEYSQLEHMDMVSSQESSNRWHMDPKLRIDRQASKTLVQSDSAEISKLDPIRSGNPVLKLDIGGSDHIHIRLVQRQPSNPHFVGNQKKYLDDILPRLTTVVLGIPTDLSFLDHQIGGPYAKADIGDHGDTIALDGVRQIMRHLNDLEEEEQILMGVIVKNSLEFTSSHYSRLVLFPSSNRKICLALGIPETSQLMELTGVLLVMYVELSTITSITKLGIS